MSAQPATPAKRRRRPGIYMRLQKGAMVPVDQYAVAAIRRKHVKVGDVVEVDFRLLRNYKFNRKVHALGKLCVANLNHFRNVDAHGAIKKIQLEADIHCETMMVHADGLWLRITEWMSESVGEVVRPALVLIGGLIRGKAIPVRVPASIAFDSMSEDDFADLFKRMCHHLAEVHWPDLSESQIEAMAELMPDGDP